MSAHIPEDIQKAKKTDGAKAKDSAAKATRKAVLKDPETVIDMYQTIVNAIRGQFDTMFEKRLIALDAYARPDLYL